MTMGFRNRPSPDRGRHDGSPVTGRIAVGAVCAGVGIMSVGIPIMALLLPFAGIGLFCAVFKPGLFE